MKRPEPTPENEVFVRLAPAKRELPKLFLPRFVLLYELARADALLVSGRAEGGLSSNAPARFISRPLAAVVRDADVDPEEPTRFACRFTSVEGTRPDGVPRPEPHPSRAEP